MLPHALSQTSACWGREMPFWKWSTCRVKASIFSTFIPPQNIASSILPASISVPAYCRFSDEANWANTRTKLPFFQVDVNVLGRYFSPSPWDVAGFAKIYGQARHSLVCLSQRRANKYVRDAKHFSSTLFSLPDSAEGEAGDCRFSLFRESSARGTLRATPSLLAVPVGYWIVCRGLNASGSA